MTVRVRIQGQRRRVATYAAALVALAVAAPLALVAPARGEPAPLVSLGPVTVGDGIATFSGGLGSAGTTATLTANGQPVSVDASGSFTATIALGGPARSSSRPGTRPTAKASRSRSRSAPPGRAV